MGDAKPIKIHIGTSPKIDTDKLGSLVNEIMHEGIIESLIYLTASRPEIVFSMDMCTEFHVVQRSLI